FCMRISITHDPSAYITHKSTYLMCASRHESIMALIRQRPITLTEAFAFMHRPPLIRKKRERPEMRHVLTLSVLFLFWLFGSTAFGETPAPSVHWGSLAFPDQYSTLTTGLTLNRFTPIDGAGNKYDSTVPNTLGFNLITFSWTQHGHDRYEGWSI